MGNCCCPKTSRPSHCATERSDSGKVMNPLCNEDENKSHPTPQFNSQEGICSPTKPNPSTVGKLKQPGFSFSGHRPKPTDERTHEKFKLRVGPDYRWNKKKSQSSEGLFELVTVDFVRSDSLIGDIENLVDLESIDIVGSTVTSSVPLGFVISVGLPQSQPKLFKSPTDGPSWNLIFYFKLKNYVQEELKNLPNARPCVKLLEAWCSNAPNDADFRGRLKTMCVVDNIESLGLPSVITAYNGKPVLINKSGTLSSPRDGLMQLNINVWMFAYVARKALCGMHEKLKKMSLNVGFTIEGRSDDELPECLLGSCSLNGIDVERVIEVKNHL